ncbi:MAG: hypothetical protein KKF44_05650 [Nanoarchaeota archaeon]|nr:hypothetical protein [Nanoarchaeota archaeon]
MIIATQNDWRNELFDTFLALTFDYVLQKNKQKITMDMLPELLEKYLPEIHISYSKKLNKSFMKIPPNYDFGAKKTTAMPPSSYVN